MTKEIKPVAESTLVAERIHERSNLQRLLREKIEVVAPDTMVLAEEFGDWEDSKRRIDLLCLDTEANLVVVELKRTEEGAHMELQAIRYAAMVSTMTFEMAVAVHAAYLKRLDRSIDSKASILEFLDWDEPDEDSFGQDVRIVLVAGNFSPEITTAALWLNERDLDIQCVRLQIYNLNGKTLMDAQRIIPLPEAGNYLTHLRIKSAAIRDSRNKNDSRDLSVIDLTIANTTVHALNARRLIFEAVRALIEHQKTPEQISELLPPSEGWLSVDGDCSVEEFIEKVSVLRAPRGGPYRLSRYFCEDDQLFRVSGKTHALTNRWSHSSALAAVDNFQRSFPELQISYVKAEEES